ncbi:reverse transcriptase domain-containing protein [Tanacetum coccineum]
MGVLQIGISAMVIENKIPSPPLPPILSPLHVSSPPPASPTYPLGYRAAMIRLRAEALSTSHLPPPHIILSHTRVDTPPLGTPPLLPIPLHTSSPSLLLPSADHVRTGPRFAYHLRSGLFWLWFLRRTERVAREFTYQDFMKCKPLYFKGTEGVVELTQWFKRMETIFRISNCFVENQIKFSTCTLLAGALTWWNSYVLTVSHDVAHAMTWADLRKKITNKYCLRNEMKKLEAELWNLKVKGTNVIGYNQRFQELALLYVRMFPEESDKIERYVGRLPDMIHGNIVASKPKTMQEAVEMATELMDKKVSAIAERQVENKRKFENTSRNNQNQQQQNKRQNIGRAYTAGTGEKESYRGSKPLCAKCDYHHDGPCAPKCHKCNKVGHFARDCRSTGNANNANNQRGTGSGQKPTCFKCGVQGHFKRECPKLKNNKNRNQVGNDRAPAKVYVVGHAGKNPDSNIMTGTFLLNNCYASILFDTGVPK